MESKDVIEFKKKVKRDNLFKVLYVAIMGAIFVASAVYAQNEKNTVVQTGTEKTGGGNDVYNFYFQKAPGPLTVIQGGQDAQSVQAQSPAAVQQSSQHADPSTSTTATGARAVGETDAPLKHWEIFGGPSFFSNPMTENNPSYTGASLGGRYHTSKYFGLGTTLSYSKTTDFYVDPGARALLNISLDLILTPIQINLFGYDFIDISAVGGVLSAYGSGHLYLGPRLDLRLNPTAALFGEWRLFSQNPETQAKQFIGGLSVRF